MHDEARPAEDALALLQALCANQVSLDHGRCVLAIAYLMTVPSLEHALRLLEVVEEVHAGRGLDLHCAVRGRGGRGRARRH
jgi:hypothetical protein